MWNCNVDSLFWVKYMGGCGCKMTAKVIIHWAGKMVDGLNLENGSTSYSFLSQASKMLFDERKG